MSPTTNEILAVIATSEVIAAWSPDFWEALKVLVGIESMEYEALKTGANP